MKTSLEAFCKTYGDLHDAVVRAVSIESNDEQPFPYNHVVLLTLEAMNLTLIESLPREKLWERITVRFLGPERFGLLNNNIIWSIFDWTHFAAIDGYLYFDFHYDGRDINKKTLADSSFFIYCKEIDVEVVELYR